MVCQNVSTIIFLFGFAIPTINSVNIMKNIFLPYFGADPSWQQNQFDFFLRPISCAVYFQLCRIILSLFWEGERKTRKIEDLCGAEITASARICNKTFLALLLSFAGPTNRRLNYRNDYRQKRKFEKNLLRMRVSR